MTPNVSFARSRPTRCLSRDSSTISAREIARVTEHEIWRTSDDVNADFELNAAAPIVRTQNIVHLVNAITGWYKKAPAAL